MVKMIIAGDDLPRPLLEQIGRITVTFGQLEHLLKVLVKRELQMNFSDGMAEAEKLQTVTALRNRISERFAVNALDQAKEAKVDAALTQVSALYRRRHDVVHALYAKTQDGKVYYSRRGGKNPPNLADLRQRARSVILVLNELIPPRRR